MPEEHCSECSETPMFLAQGRPEDSSKKFYSEESASFLFLLLSEKYWIYLHSLLGQILYMILYFCKNTCRTMIKYFY